MGWGSMAVWGGGPSTNVLVNSTYSSTAPGLSFVGSPTLGITQSSGNAIYFVSNGTTMTMNFGVSQFNIPSTYIFGISPSDPSSAGADVGLGRGGAGVVKLTDGSTGGGTFSAPANSPAAIAANTNDYAAGSKKSYFQRWSASGAFNVTGLSLSQVDGQEHLIVNTGANNITLTHQDALSTAANRFLCSTGANIVLSANQAADIVYDAAVSRWLVFKRT